MQVIAITNPGAPDVLRLADADTPTAGAGEVLIRVHASGVNRPDVLQRKGAYPPPAGASPIPGLEVAGVVASGDTEAMAAAGLKVGDAVCALVAGGGYASWCVAPVVQCLPVPKGLSMVEAAALPETFFTVWSNVFDRAGLLAGETVLIQGGSSGIGVTAIQLAKAMGAHVLVTAGSDEKCQACLDLGADHAINYKTSDFAERVLALTQGRGVDVILDMVAGSYVAREVGCLAEDGRLVIIAVQGGIDASFDASLVLRKRLKITGSTLRPRPVAFKAAIAAQLKATVWPLLEAGSVRVQIFKTFAAADAAQAHALMESNAHIGKIMLTWPVDAEGSAA
ncbi:MAG: NAD(P)H-quinone oxidoreductase [Burkholderiaceae bacterium]|nr:NAD(P)H-quinone oxidoreductase [Betaproteobacteria bacterium]MDO7554320.1 NAD(P)H-quinone oxidoreductase [Burkholderiaceae bacterium]MDO7579396.1 NAD(P)H-quinone oxidoreductase [Burkholderiaceae bacterium]MDO7595967.1 NAD(P)H-quinone oxidoreductase [Burkholderiaceae bacterium]MDO7604327.1 NAD(P)H-quinone oxidoreductase [Burkholderiaceae bacterium]